MTLLRGTVSPTPAQLSEPPNVSKDDENTKSTLLQLLVTFLIRPAFVPVRHVCSQVDENKKSKIKSKLRSSTDRAPSWAAGDSSYKNNSTSAALAHEGERAFMVLLN